MRISSLVGSGSSSPMLYMPEAMSLVSRPLTAKHTFSTEVNVRRLSKAPSGQGRPLDTTEYNRLRLPLLPGP